MTNRLPPPLDLPGDDSMEGLDFGFLSGIIEPGMVKESALAAGGGAAFGFLYRLGLNASGKYTKEDIDAWTKANPTPAADVVAPVVGGVKQYLNANWKKVLAALGGGIVLGRAAWMVSPDAAKGIVGAAGAAIGEIAYKVMFQKKETDADFTGKLENGSPDTDLDLSGLGSPEDEALLSGGEVLTVDRRLLGSTGVSERRPGEVAGLETWIS